MVPNLIDPPPSQKDIEFSDGYHRTCSYVAQQMKLKFYQGKYVFASYTQIAAFNERVRAAMIASMPPLT